MELENGPKRREGSKNNDSGEEYLLEELVLEEILPRLPVKSLINFKLVSKKWLDLITDSRFISNHLRRQSETTKLSIILPARSSHIQRGLTLDHHRNEVEVVDISSSLTRFAGKFCTNRVVGSCNGLLCLSLRSFLVNKREAVVLWNPETGEARDARVPPLSSSFYERRMYGDYPIYGFGFDEPRGDYMVVRIVPTGSTLLNFDIFSRNTGRWRTLDKALSGYAVFNETFDSVLLNGHLYWLVLTVENNTKHRRCILSFDLYDREFRIIDALKDSVPYKYSIYPHRLVKWEGNCIAYITLPAQQTTAKSDEFGFRIVVGPNGMSDRIFFWSSEPLPSFVLPFDWRFCGVSRGRFFVSERLRCDPYTTKIVMYDPFCRDYENVGCQEAVTLYDLSFYYGVAHDYVRSLVSVYPDQKTKEKLG